MTRAELNEMVDRCTIHMDDPKTISNMRAIWNNSKRLYRQRQQRLAKHGRCGRFDRRLR